MTPTFKPEAPYLWPDPRVLAGQSKYDSVAPFHSLFADSPGVMGLVSGLSDSGMNWLAEQLSTNLSLKVRLVVAISPAGATQQHHLECLADLRESFAGRAEFRLLLSPSRQDKPSDLLVIQDDVQKYFLCTGATSDLGFARFFPSHANLVLRCDPLLMEAVRNWFNWVWSEAIPLTRDTTCLPALVPAPGTFEAQAAWDHYVELCEHARVACVQETGQPELIVNVETGQVEYKSSAKVELSIEGKPDSQESQLPTDALGIQPLDPLAVRIQHLFEKGATVAISRADRIPPLDLPLDPKWLGLERLVQVGSARRELHYRISALDDETLRAVERNRLAIGRVLEKMSYQLGDGIRWIPDTARGVFEKELDAVNAHGFNALKDAVHNDAKAFVVSQENRIRRDVTLIYQHDHPGKEPSEDGMKHILAAVEERLETVLNGTRLLPDVSYGQVSFQLENKTPWSDPWGQALSLLHSIAMYPRQAITKSGFLGGLSISKDRGKFLKVMDVCDDGLLSLLGHRECSEIARVQLIMLEEIMTSQADSRVKCQAIFQLMEGARRSTLAKILNIELERDLYKKPARSNAHH